MVLYWLNNTGQEQALEVIDMVAHGGDNWISDTIVKISYGIINF